MLPCMFGNFKFEKSYRFINKIFIVTETKGFPSEVCHSWVKNDGQQEIVPKEAKDTIYSNKSAELTKVMENIDRGPLSESM